MPFGLHAPPGRFHEPIMENRILRLSKGAQAKKGQGCGSAQLLQYTNSGEITRPA